MIGHRPCGQRAKCGFRASRRGQVAHLVTLASGENLLRITNRSSAKPHLVPNHFAFAISRQRLFDPPKLAGRLLAPSGPGQRISSATLVRSASPIDPRSFPPVDVRRVDRRQAKGRGNTCPTFIQIGLPPLARQRLSRSACHYKGQIACANSADQRIGLEAGKPVLGHRSNFSGGAADVTQRFRSSNFFICPVADDQSAKRCDAGACPQNIHSRFPGSKRSFTSVPVGLRRIKHGVARP